MGRKLRDARPGPAVADRFDMVPGPCLPQELVFPASRPLRAGDTAGPPQIRKETMKTRTSQALILSGLLLAALPMQGCYGNFNLTRKVYNWNGTLGDKFVKSLVMCVMIIVPVYGLAGLADLVILNLVEFWTGSNPMALKQGEREIRFVEHEGVRYMLTATTNRLDIARAEGDPATTSLVFDPVRRAWFAVTPERTIQLAEDVSPDGAALSLIHPDGTRERIAAH